MMKKYKLTLKTLSNLHIGSGDITQTFECFYDKNKFSFIDVDKLTEELINNNLEQRFINEILQIRHADQRRNVDRNMKNILTRLGYHNHDMFKKYTVAGQSSLNVHGKVVYRPIERFIRNKDEEVYVPGSSIKGFMSNILKLLNKEDENEIFIANRLRISDSKPISNDNLWITRVSYYQDLYKYDKSKKEKSLPKDGQSNYVEFIKPNVEIEFIVTLDPEYISIEKFKEELQFFNSNYYNMYQRRFITEKSLGEFDDLGENDEMYEGNVFRIGKYTNFLLKTEHISNNFGDDNDDGLFELLEEENKKQRLFTFPKNSKKMREKMEREKRYPLALKLSYNPDGYYRENGICSFKFEEIV